MKPKSAESPAVNAEIENADREAEDGERPVGKVGPDDRIQAMEQKTALEGGGSSPGLKVLLGKRQRAGPGAGFHCDSPAQGENVGRAPPGAATRPEGSEDDQKEPEEMHRHYQNSEGNHEGKNSLAASGAQQGRADDLV